jgi:hypothetical protein
LPQPQPLSTTESSQEPHALAAGRPAPQP